MIGGQRSVFGREWSRVSTSGRRSVHWFDKSLVHSVGRCSLVDGWCWITEINVRERRCKALYIESILTGKGD